MLGAWWRKNVIEKVHAAAYSGRFAIKVRPVHERPPPLRSKTRALASPRPALVAGL